MPGPYGIVRSAIAGSIAGVGATLLMSALMLGARRAGFTPRLPPVRIAEEAIEAVADRPATQDEEHVTASVLHLAFGAACGAMYGVFVSPRLPSSAAAAASGVVFASGIWLVSYQGWVPGLRILPPATRDDRGRVTTMVAAHWLYGAALGVGTRLLRRLPGGTL